MEVRIRTGPGVAPEPAVRVEAERVGLVAVLALERIGAVDDGARGRRWPPSAVSNPAVKSVMTWSVISSGSNIRPSWSAAARMDIG
ncbi:hypothetical protein ACIQCR_17395 [Streptomyces sp. NPDC093249]|uniref:hypothetical protein n=1 Tax=unclassified Streptomyces TaxID=2593676 RepID=UPI00344FF53C